MKAIVCGNYGSPLDLEIKDLEIPQPKENELLVKVKATAINDFDWSLVTGKPYLYRIMFGLWRPKTPVPGIELSGTVHKIGSKVNRFKIGDPVYGDISKFGWGSFAEYVCVREESMVRKPEGMSYLDAAAIPHASMLAYQGLFDLGKLKKGQKLLINGAGGGMGTFALQLAKLYDSDVTGVDTGEKLEMMKSLGFDKVIDYREQSFTEAGERYHLILDAKTTRMPGDYRKALHQNGVYVTVGGEISNLFRVFIANKIGASDMQVLALKQNKDLSRIHQYYQENHIKPVIDGPYRFEEIPKLLERFGQASHQGKMVVTFPDESQQ